MMGGQVGVADHITIGAGAMLGARAGVMSNVPAGARWGGFPAEPAHRLEARRRSRCAGWCGAAAKSEGTDE